MTQPVKKEKRKTTWSISATVVVRISPFAGPANADSRYAIPAWRRISGDLHVVE